MRVLKTICSHLTLVLSLVFVVFLVLDQFNPMMNFVDNAISHWLLALLCVSGIILAVCAWADSNRKE